ncbi:hypothetical protein F441_04740 [Phytophthora nicotianae CJ01A1]|uniref:Uncharacterized protein n=4 Tax=Phytophthora nicotianae TaxID=4792 RepID=V9FMM8_PHYNI|nr:hypothetical protein F443_04738 [Phytophthora nicotianae P1569]ETP21825.1 hypothetical protein F441_04740 [Phytophthora nicotianae CJ01A1]
MGVHRSSVYRWRKQKTKLEDDKKNGSKFYVNPKEHEAQRVHYLNLENSRHSVSQLCCPSVVDCAISKEKSSCHSARYAQEINSAKRYADVADSFANSVNFAVEMNGVLSCHNDYEKSTQVSTTWTRRRSLLTTPENLQWPTVKHAILTSFKAQSKTQDDAAFLCASAIGVKLKQFIVFAGKPGCRVASQVTSQSCGCISAEYTVQEKAWFAIQVSPVPNATLNSLNVHEMTSIREMLGTERTTQG